ncbi:MAG: hypothetical protein AB7G23_08600 [Vicinamibacterales bacterium]
MIDGSARRSPSGRLRVLGAALCLQVGFAPAALAQVNADRLPIDLERVERQLRRSSERDEADGLRLRFNVEVYARAPRVELFAPDEDLQHGPLPFSAPTHQEFLQHVTPREFSSPAMDFSALLRFLMQKRGSP